MAQKLFIFLISMMMTVPGLAAIANPESNIPASETKQYLNNTCFDSKEGYICTLPNDPEPIQEVAKNSELENDSFEELNQSIF